MSRRRRDRRSVSEKSRQPARADNCVATHALDRTLTDLINLGLVAKQAHWNLTGPAFGNLHLLLDDVAEVAREAGDTVAERSITLGHHPDGRVATVAANNPLASLDVGPLRDADVISAFGEILELITNRLYGSIRSVECDLVTQAILIDAVGRLERLAWMIRAHDGR